MEQSDKIYTRLWNLYFSWIAICVIGIFFWVVAIQLVWGPIFHFDYNIGSKLSLLVAEIFSFDGGQDPNIISFLLWLLILLVVIKMIYKAKEKANTAKKVGLVFDIVFVLLIFPLIVDMSFSLPSQMFPYNFRSEVSIFQDINLFFEKSPVAFLLLFHLFFHFFAGYFFLYGSIIIRSFLSLVFLLVLAIGFDKLPVQFALSYTKIYQSVFILLLFLFNFLFGFKSRNKKLICFLLYFFPGFFIINRYNTQFDGRIETNLFLFVKGQILHSHEKIRILTTTENTEMVIKEQATSVESGRFSFEFSDLPKICYGYESSEGSDIELKKLSTKNCWSYEAGVLIQEANSRFWNFSFFPKIKISLNKAFIVGENEFVFNLNDYIFYFDGTKKELNFIGKGEIIFAVPSENIISITKPE